MTAGRVLLACAAAALGAFGPVLACVRHADIRDEPEGGILAPEPQIDAGEIPELDSGLGTDAYPSCGERPLGKCQGTNDFPCAFEGWMVSTAESCQTSTGCVTNGWLEVTMGAEGCVEAIGMDQPNDAMVACLLAELGAVRCPCLSVKGSYFFGYGNMGVCAE